MSSTSLGIEFVASAVLSGIPLAYSAANTAMSDIPLLQTAIGIYLLPYNTANAVNPG